MVKVDKHKIIYIHIPKCGGTSIEQMLCPDRSNFMKLSFYFLEKKNRLLHRYIMYLFYHYECIRIFISYIFNFINCFFPDKYNFANNTRYLNHLPINYYVNINSYHKCTTVRNPYTRLISAYKHLYIRDTITFEDFCISVKKDLIKYERNPKFNINVFFLPQLFFINEDLINIHIIKLENLDEGWDIFLKENNIILDDGTIPHTNKTYSDNIHMTKKSINIINEIYHLDFLKLNYKKISS